MVIRRCKSELMGDVLPERERRSEWEGYVTRFVALRIQLVMLKSFVETVERVREKEEADPKITALQTLR